MQETWVRIPPGAILPSRWMFQKKKYLFMKNNVKLCVSTYNPQSAHCVCFEGDCSCKCLVLAGSCNKFVWWSRSQSPTPKNKSLFSIFDNTKWYKTFHVLWAPSLCVFGFWPKLWSMMSIQVTVTVLQKIMNRNIISTLGAVNDSPTDNFRIDFCIFPVNLKSCRAECSGVNVKVLFSSAGFELITITSLCVCLLATDLLDNCYSSA